jgi:hypothetical protein
VSIAERLAMRTIRTCENECREEPKGTTSARYSSYGKTKNPKMKNITAIKIPIHCLLSHNY